MSGSCHDWSILRQSPNLLNSALNWPALVVVVLYKNIKVVGGKSKEESRSLRNHFEIESASSRISEEMSGILRNLQEAIKLSLLA